MLKNAQKCPGSLFFRGILIYNERSKYIKRL